MPRTFVEWLIALVFVICMLWIVVCVAGVLVAIACGVKYLMAGMICLI